MTIKSRRLLFLGFFLLFILIGAGIVFYSFGWRLDFSTFKFQKTGAISLKTIPRDVVIEINNKIYPDQTTIIQSETLIQNLTPKTYKVKISKEGYLPFYKTIVVEPEMVTRFINTFLIPEDITPKDLLQARGEKIIDTGNKASKFIIQNGKSGIFYLYDLNTPESAFNINTFVSGIKKGELIKNIVFVPFDTNRFVLEDAAGLKLLDKNRKTLEIVDKNPVIIWSLKNSSLYFINKDSATKKLTLSSFNLVFKSKTDLAVIATSTQIDPIISKVKASEDGNFIAFSDSAGRLFLFSAKEQSTKAIGDDVKDFSFAPDNRKIALLDYNKKITIKFLDDFDADIRKKAGDIVQFGLTDNISSIMWFGDSFHLFTTSDNGLKFMEIDDRQPLNIHNLFSGDLEFYYDRGNNVLLFVNEGKLKAVDFENL